MQWATAPVSISSFVIESGSLDNSITITEVHTSLELHRVPFYVAYREVTVIFSVILGKELSEGAVILSTIHNF